MDLEVGRVGPVEGMAAGGEFVEDEAQSEDVGLDGGLAGDELLWRHVGDGAASRGVGGSEAEAGFAYRTGPEGSKSASSRERRRARPKSRILIRPPSVSMTLAGLRSRWKMPSGVRGGEAVGDLDSGGEDELEAGWALGDELVKRLAGDVLHDDVGFGLLGAVVTGVGCGLPYVVDGADVGMVDGGGETGLAELGGAHLLDGEIAALE